MLISKEEIIKYLKNVPPVPENVKNALSALDEGDLKKAAIEASNDLVLKKRIQSVVNSAYYGLSHKVEDMIQLFAMLGSEKSRSLISVSYTHLTLPTKA